MKLGLYQASENGPINPCLITDRGVVDIAGAVGPLAALPPQQCMEGIIDHYDELRPALEIQNTDGEAQPLESIQLKPPLPRPGKIICCIGNYWEHAEREPKPLNMFLKNPDAVIGPDDTVMLPEFTEPWVFHHEAELAIVTKGPSKSISRENWRDAVFGYTAMIDVTARGVARSTWRSGSWMGKSFDTFAPIGPCIVTADEVTDPNDLHVRFWCSGELRHDYNTNDMEHPVPELIEFASMIMTLHSGNLIACGTNHEGLGALQDRDVGEIEIQGIGKMSVNITDPLKREWERGVYMGENSTNPAAVAAAKKGA